MFPDASNRRFPEGTESKPFDPEKLKRMFIVQVLAFAGACNSKTVPAPSAPPYWVVP
jgi:hypothetical protein